jgi:hypothetical protein
MATRSIPNTATVTVPPDYLLPLEFKPLKALTTKDVSVCSIVALRRRLADSARLIADSRRRTSGMQAAMVIGEGRTLSWIQE